MLTILSSQEWSPPNILTNHNKIPVIKNKNTSNTIKSMILLGLISKYSKRNYTKESAFFKWYSRVKAQSSRMHVWKKILTQQRISQFTFLYRIKAHCEESEPEYEGEIKFQSSANLKPYSSTKQENRRYEMEEGDKQKCELKILNSNSEEQEQMVEKMEQKPAGYQEKDFKKKRIKNHLCSISQQASNKILSQEESQIDLIDMLDKRIQRIQQKLKIAALRTLNIVVCKIRYRQRQFFFSLLCSDEGGV